MSLICIMAGWRQLWCIWASELHLKHPQLAEKWLTFVRDVQCLKIAVLISFKRSLGVDAFKLRSWEFLSQWICLATGVSSFWLNIWELFSLIGLQLYITFMLERGLSRRLFIPLSTFFFYLERRKCPVDKMLV